MKLTNKQLKQIISEELRSVINEFVGNPTIPIDRALKDPQVDEKIKMFLASDQPEGRQQGLQLLHTLYPDDYPSEESEVLRTQIGYHAHRSSQFHPTCMVNTAENSIER